MPQFRHIAILTALLFLVLAAAWMFFPAVVLKGWGVDFSDSTGLMSRRAAALYAGMGVMFLVARNAEPSLGRSSLVAGMVTALLILAGLGVFELLTGHATSGILVAAFVEVIWALAFICVSCTERTAKASAENTRRSSARPDRVAHA